MGIRLSVDLWGYATIGDCGPVQAERRLTTHVGEGNKLAMPRRGKPGRPPRGTGRPQKDEPRGTVPLPRIRRKKPQHRLVVTLPHPLQREPHPPRQMQIPHRHGVRGMRVMPDARGWARVPSWDWRGAGVDGKRSDTVMRAVRVGSRLDALAALPAEEAAVRLQSLPGIGPWTAAETLQRSHGAADAVTVGDLHLPRRVGFALEGVRECDDEAMLRLLSPYAGQRYRAARLILLGAPSPPRRGPRLAPARHR